MSTMESATVAAPRFGVGLRGMPRLVLIRRVALILYGAVFLVALVRWGIPVERNQVLAWILIGLACLSIGRERREIVRLAVDWLPLAALLVVYDLSRGAADAVGMPVHTDVMIDIDRWLFLGVLPSEWLQANLLAPGHIQFYEVGLALVYTTHFIAAWVVAAYLWIRYRPGFLGFVKRLVTLSTAGLLTYILFPAVPPWMASREHVIGHVSRTSFHGFNAIGVQVADSLERSQATVNQIAAMPSLHAGFALLISIFLWRYVHGRWRILLVLYPLAMGFTLVTTGEHYVADVLVGYAYAFGICRGWDWWERTHPKRPKVKVAPELLDAVPSARYS